MMTVVVGAVTTVRLVVVVSFDEANRVAFEQMAARESRALTKSGYYTESTRTMWR